MENIVIKKENGVVRIINANKDLINKITKGYTNPCAECKKCNSNDCEKVADGNNKHIEKYDFITDGYQINGSDGELQNLVVRNCSNFEKQPTKPRPKTPEELLELKRLRESLKIAYFNAYDIEEADRTQYDLMMRGQLVKYNPNLNGLHKNK